MEKVKGWMKRESRMLLESKMSHVDFSCSLAKVWATASSTPAHFLVIARSPQRCVSPNLKNQLSRWSPGVVCLCSTTAPSHQSFWKGPCRCGSLEGYVETLQAAPRGPGVHPLASPGSTCTFQPHHYTFGSDPPLPACC